MLFCLFFSQSFSTHWQQQALVYLLIFDPDSYFVGPLLAVCSISPRPVVQHSSVPAVSAQTEPADPNSSAAGEDQISPQNQATAGRAPKKQLSFVLENEKQQWWQTVRKKEEKECEPMNSVCLVISNSTH